MKGYTGKNPQPFILDEQERASRREPEFALLMIQMALAAKSISCGIRRATLSGHIGFSGSANPTGDSQKELDVIANQIVFDAFLETGLVADLHRNLLDGGILLYPGDDNNRSGKLRLLYECVPLALLIEQAGDRASTGRGRILDLDAESLHQRAPLAIGTAHEVELDEAFVATGGPS